MSALLGEGAQLFPDGSVRWVDLLRGTVYLRRAGRSRVVARHPHEVSRVLPWTGGTLALTRAGIVAIDDDGHPCWTLELTGGDDTLRCSDGTVLPDGSVAVGIVDRALAPGRGRLLRVLTDGTIIPVIDGATIPNGIGVTADGTAVLWVDSPTRTLLRFAIDPRTAGLGAARPVITLSEEWGVPDGLCADRSGGAWIAMWGGGRVVHVTGQGEIDRTITLGVDHVTSVAFDAEDALIITTASIALSAAERATAPGAGALWGVPFAAHGTRGPAPHVSTLAPPLPLLPPDHSP